MNALVHIIVTSLTKGTLRLTCKWLNNLSTLVRYIVERKQGSFSHVRSWQLLISEACSLWTYLVYFHWNVIHQLYPADNTEIYAIAQYLICLHNLMCYSANFIQKCAFRFNNFYIINTNINIITSLLLSQKLLNFAFLIGR